MGFLRGLRIAILTVAVTILFGLTLPNLVARIDAPPGPAVQVACFLLLMAVAAADVVLVLRDRSWGRLRWPVLVLLLAVYLGFTLLLPADSVFTVDNWYFNSIGWFGVALLFDQPLLSFVGFLAGCVAVSVLPILVSGPGNGNDVVGLAITIVSIGGFQTLTATAAGALRQVAFSAALVSASAERTRTRRAVAQRVHLDRQSRYRDIATTAGPVLSGLADGSLDPGDPEVVRKCAIEAARMRRLFAENKDTGDKLSHELRACVDIAERRGVAVDLISQGNWRDLPREIRRALTDGPMQVLSTLSRNSRTARVTLIGTRDTVSVSVLADSDAPVPRLAETAGVRTTSIFDGERVWVEATWREAGWSQR
ncbi:hypothetical protein [Kibdelosporangium persicum]|uniref:hypothetical protein n=1 Tax=Kibdelosporangium persicum TaxID=2698649 RepID=UPI0015647A4D|nr:hypothetical protein [Kibdelosporangium persicum]